MSRWLSSLMICLSLAAPARSQETPKKPQVQRPRLKQQPNALPTNVKPATAAADGMRPLGRDGKPLNLDFETGTLDGWVAEGKAFANQPVKGDAVAKRRPDMQSRHTGEYWIGTFEGQLDKPQGTLTSAPFVVAQPFATFLIGGGMHETTCVQILRNDTQQVVSQTSGRDSEDMFPAVIDLRAHLGKEIVVRLVDKHSGGWGHLNFDDFRFHADKPGIVGPAVAKAPSAVELYEYAGLSGEQAAKEMTVPEGFSVQLFAAEPDVMQPIAMALDERGRLWIAEAYSYPIRLPEAQAKDRIVIFEDENGDGKFDKRTIFAERLNLVSGLEVGFGGVWVGAAPHLLFIPDRDRDDKPDGPPQILLDGWGYEDTHETLNAFNWGPDGWLYGCHGVFTHSRVGKPGTPSEQRVPINAGIWRYHPQRHEFEVFAEGTSNPWGVDFNDRGQAFVTACVIPHLYHIIQNGRYQRQAGTHFNPNTYDDIKTIAKHRHWLGNQWNDGDRAASDDLGGGHAHAGAMFYLGGSWPAKYRDQLFMNNIHGQRINVDVLAQEGSGYVGDFQPDFLFAHDRWSQCINMRYGPDGQVYLIDWYDKQACHRREPDVHDRSNGRIFKIVYGKPEPVKVDLAKCSDAELVAYQSHSNDWFVRQARRLLQERGAKAETQAALAKLAFTAESDAHRLRGLWALHVGGGLNEERLKQALDSDRSIVRAWAVQLALDDAKATPADWLLKRFNDMAKGDPAQEVRLYLASAAGRVSLDARWDLLAGLLSHAEDAGDHNLPLMYWYALEPLVTKDMNRALAMAANGKVPLAYSYVVRRIGGTGSPEAIELLAVALGKLDEPGQQLGLLQGVNQALKGRRQAPMPPSWPAVFAKLAGSANADVRSQATALAVTFGDPQALDAMKALVLDAKADAALRQQALASLLGAKAKALAPALIGLLNDPQMSGPALRGLAAYDDPSTPVAVLAAYDKLDAAGRRDAVATLASRAAYAQALLTAVAEKKVASADLSADVIRQLRNLKNADLDKRLNEVWGTVRDTPQEKVKLIAQYKAMLTSEPSAPPDTARGRAIFAKTCQQCHTLFGTGGKVGPELTGSNRANLDYLLSNILDPSAVMAKEYMPSVIATSDGRIVTGIVKQQDQNSLTVVTANETLVIPRGEVDEIQLTKLSMMPEDILKPLPESDVRSLAAYLASPAQSPLLATAETLKSFFNGKDLAGWQGDPALWSVEGGEIVGRTSGLKRNEWLTSEQMLGDFRFSCQVKLLDNAGNSGIQFRSERLPQGIVKGYQADVGAGWWGKLYEEHARALLWDKSGEAHVKLGEWNKYEIEAVGSRVRTWINDQPCVDLDDPPGARRGIIGLQLHSGGKTEVRYKDLKVELLAPTEGQASK